MTSCSNTARRAFSKPESASLAPYSQHFIFIVTYEWDQHVRVFHYTGLERLVREKHSRLLGTVLKLRRKLSVVNTVPDEATASTAVREIRGIA